MENHNELIHRINSLITLNNDRSEGYELASKETNDYSLKVLFDGFSRTSRDFALQLGAEAYKLGTQPEEGTTAAGKLYRAWMEVKTAFTGKDRKAILTSCEYGEDVIKDAYEDVLESEMNMPVSLLQLITSQQEKLIDAHNIVKSMRDEPIAV
jgi:uncharacterized protein (TIGR02284 family)